jgi:tetrapyrrole methylase family protein/MazG family protein
MGFLEIAWARLGIDPVENSVRLIDGHQFATAAAGLTGPLLVAHCHANWVLSDIKLAAEDADNMSNDDLPVVILHHLGLPDEVVMTVPWSELDHSIEADHLTSMYIPQLRVPVGHDLVAFHELARTLRRECPWDREQTHQTLTTYLLEETYEVVDAIAALNIDDAQTDDHLLEELGDLLYQIEFHAAIAEQEGRFTMGDVARGIHEKLVRRHPHVFSPTVGSNIDNDALVKSWDDIKKAEKAAKGIVAGPFDGIPQATGSLAYASAILKRATKAGIPIEIPSHDPQALGDIADLGMHLLEVVAECRRRGVDPEVALRKVSNIQRQNAERHTDA